MSFFDFLQNYNGAASAIAAFLALFLNAFSVALAAFLYKENKKLREEGSEPHIVVFLYPTERFPTIANIVVANVGKGPARNIKITHDATETDFVRCGVHSRSLSLFEGWRVLPQGERLSLFFGEWPKLLSDPKLPPFNVQVSYESADGRILKTSYRLNVAEFDGIITIGSPPDHEMAEALKKISDQLKNWASGFSRLKVETITTREKQRLDQENLERFKAKRDAAKKPKE